MRRRANATSHPTKPRWSGPPQPDGDSYRTCVYRTCVREHSGGHPPKSRPSRHPGRASPGHGGGHGRRPAAPDAATPEHQRARSTRPAPRRADSQRSSFPVRQVAARTRAPPGRELKSWNPGNLEGCDARQDPRFPDSQLADSRSPRDLVQTADADSRTATASGGEESLSPRTRPFTPATGLDAATLRRHGGRRVTGTRAERGAESAWMRLRRRKVVQWGAVYVAAAWGFLQGLEYVSESFNWPQHV